MSLKVMTLTVSLAGIVKVMARYLPEYTASGDLVLPKNCHEWVYVGSRSNRTRLMVVRPMSPRITTATSSRARTRYTERPAYFPAGPSYLKSCTLRFRRRTPTVPEPSRRAGGYFAMSRPRIPSATPRPGDGECYNFPRAEGVDRNIETQRGVRLALWQARRQMTCGPSSIPHSTSERATRMTERAARMTRCLERSV